MADLPERWQNSKVDVTKYHNSVGAIYEVDEETYEKGKDAGVLCQIVDGRCYLGEEMSALDWLIGGTVTRRIFTSKKHLKEQVALIDRLHDEAEGRDRDYLDGLGHWTSAILHSLEENGSVLLRAVKEALDNEK
jgi:hypothetical protein